ncbi:MAG: YbgA family protein [Candidatus Kryptonium sp.]
MKPTVVLSACLDGFAYRYNGATVNDEIVNKLKLLFNLIHVCPEFEIGLGVPRKTIRLHKIGDDIRAIQDETEVDLTFQLEEFAHRFLEKLDSVHGFILKAKSPSCGVGSAKIYKEGNLYGKTYGIFARYVKESLPHIPLIDEGRLRNKELMWEFLVKVFTLFRFESATSDINKLIDFHSRHKYLFMSISQKHLKELGRIIAEHKPGKFDKVIKKYEMTFKDLMRHSFKRTNLVNSIIHIFGHISEDLTRKERLYFLNLVDKFKAGKVELVNLIEVLRVYAMRFENDYLLNQYFLEPFPEI